MQPPPGPPRIGTNTDSGKLLAVDWASDSLIIATCEPQTGFPTKVITAGTGRNPRAVSVGGGGTTAYTANYGASDSCLSCVPLDNPGRTVSHGSAQGACAVLADLHGDHVCVAARGDRRVLVFHGQDQQPTGHVDVPGSPFALAGGTGSARVGVALTEPDAGSQPLSVIDLSNPDEPFLLLLKGTVPGTVRDMTASPDGRFLYAVSGAENGAGTLTVVNLTGTPGIVAMASVEAGPSAVAVSRNGNAIAVACQGTASLWAAALDPVTGMPGKPALLPVALQPSALALAPDGDLAYITSGTTGQLSTVRLDLADPGCPAGGDRRDLTVGAAPSHVAFAPDGAHAYLTEQANLHTLRTGPALDGTITTGAQPVASSVTPNGTWLCTADSAANQVTVTGLTNERVAGTITLQPDTIRPWAIATGAAPAGEPFACVTSPTTGNFATLVPENDYHLGDTGHVTTHTVDLPKGTEPRAVSVTPNGRYALVTDSRTDTTKKNLLLIDLTGGSTTIPKGVVDCTEPMGIAVADNGNTLYVTDFANNVRWGNNWGSVHVLRRSDGNWACDPMESLTAKSQHLHGPNDVAVHTSGTDTTLYVTNYSEAGVEHPAGSRTVSVFTRRERGPWTFQYYIEGKDDHGPVVARPHGIALSPDGKRLYVSGTADGAVAQFNLKGEGDAPVLECWMATCKKRNAASLALSGDGAYLYATSEVTKQVYGIKVPLDAGTGSEAQMAVVQNIKSLGTSAPRAIAASGNDTLHIGTAPDGAIPPDVNTSQLVTVILDPADRLRAQSDRSDEVPLTEAPAAVAALSADGPVYLTNPTQGTVDVRGTQVKPVPMGTDDSWLWDVTCTPDGSYAYVTDRSPSVPAVHAVRLTDNTVTTLTTPADPMGVACSPDGLRAYIACHKGNTVSVLRRPPVLLDIHLPLTSSAAPKAAAAHPGGDCLYRVCGADVIATRLNRTDDGMPLTVQGACALAVRSEGQLGYVLSDSPPAVHVLDLAAPDQPKLTGTKLDLVGEGKPTAFALHAALPGRAYATGSTAANTGVLWALDVTTPEAPKLLSTVTVPVPVTALALLPGSPGHLYLLAPSGSTGSALHVWEHPSDSAAAAVQRPLARLDLEGRPRSVALHPSGGHAYVSTEDHKVHLIDLTDPGNPALAGTTVLPDTSDTGVLAPRPDGNGAWLVQSNQITGVGLGAPETAGTPWPNLPAPQQLTVSADGGRVLVTGENSGTLHLIDAATGRFRQTVTSGTALAGVTAHPDPTKERVYVADTQNRQLVIIDTAAPKQTDCQAVGLDVRQIVCE
ncbi:beta-propeller fold lactonase family protein [Streptomyces sp. NPDC048161]|uniref:beta-propeller fold lactonase family protein n=1 Tax=Streptomyces sp. NPDC048161 TaxID=3160985 RepID=UPI0033C4751B